MNTEPGEEWDVEPNDHVPTVGDEEELKRASERFATK
jgi:K+/H+ antiporter YhaU regulatory subunit KhtT